MKSVELIRDINAHIQDLECSVTAKNGVAVARINFKNNAFGVITAIKLNAQGFNSFGDIIRINNNEKFYLVIQDISINKNEFARDLIVTLPDSGIRRLLLEENQICFEDGSIVSYEGKNEVAFEIKEFDVANPIEREQLAALRDKFGSDIIFNPIEFENKWICVCGCINSQSVYSCMSCAAKKDGMLDTFSPENMTKIIESYRIAEEARQNRIHRQEIEKAKEKRKKNIGIFAAVAFLIAIIAFLANTVVLSNREIYMSEESMRAAMQGAWTHYSDYKRNPLWQTVIKDDIGTRIWSSDGLDSLESKISWNPKRGTFTILGSTYVVIKGGHTLKEGNYEYKKGGSLSSTSLDSSISQESGYSVLKITIDRVTSNSSYTICTGSVKNTGKKTYKFVEVKGSFKDADGNVIDTDLTYAAGTEGLEPDESTTFRLSVPKNSKILSCSVSLLDFN